MKWMSCAAISISMLFFSVSGWAAVTPVHEYQLKNGLKLFVKEDHRAPVVVSQVWYRVGSSYEPNGKTGVSHMLEHMMFKGTPQYGPGKLAKIVAENGGQQNAFTGYDYTAYYQQFAAEKLEISFKLEADRMRHLVLQEKDFKKELQVVMEERRLRTDDNPQALTHERFAAAAFVSNPYHHPIVGWMNDLQHLTLADVKAWYKTWYAPNNAFIVVVGDVQPNKVYQLAKHYFAPLKAEPIPAVKPRREVKPLGQRDVTVEAPAKLPWLVLGYNVPVLNTAKQKWHVYALEVAQALLEGGNSARIPKELIRGRQVASSADSGYSSVMLYSSVFSLSGTPAPGHTLEALRQAFLHEIKRLKTEKVSQQELNRVKAQVIASKVFDKDSIINQAMEIGLFEVVGLSWRDADEFIKHIDAVTPDQVQQVAKQFLTPDRLTVARLKPLPIAQTTPLPKTPLKLENGHVR